MRSLLLIMLISFGVLTTVNAQKERKFIREGNSLFDDKNYEKAEIEYRRAADMNGDSFEAAFNIADALYKQDKFEEALSQFTALSKTETDKERLAAIYHNIGNTLLSMEKLDESIEAYKESLRNNPQSDETRYNLEFARFKKEKEEENKEQQQNKDQNQDKGEKDGQKDNQGEQGDKDNQDQEQEQKSDENDEKQDEKDKKNDKQQDKEQNEQQQNEQQQQQQQGKISKEDAERLLEALQSDEKKVQEKVQQDKNNSQKAKRRKIDKNW